MSGWKKPYLIQRLNKPIGNKDILVTISQVFSFGGGYILGGFPREGLELINNIFLFDNMGADEFESGTISNSFSTISRTKEKYVSFEIRFEGKPYQEWVTLNNSRKLIQRKGKVKIVYVICRREHKVNVDRFLRHLRNGDQREIDLRKATYFRSVLFPEEKPGLKSNTKRNEEAKSEIPIKGWVDIENCFFFFIDEKMYKKTKALFDI